MNPLQIKTGNIPPIKKQSRRGVKPEPLEAVLRQHWAASAAGDQDLEHEIYDENVICDYPQSGERIHGKRNLQSLRSHHPGKPTGFSIRRLLGSGQLWITEYTIIYEGRSYYTVSIMEFENGKVVREAQYFAEGFAAPAWRAQWVEKVGTPPTA